jgi:hypothetical protein
MENAAEEGGLYGSAMTLTMHDVMINIRVVRYGLGVLF